MTSEKTFRVQVRFNKVEFAELEADLKKYEGRDLAGRIRLLMRLGLDVASGRLHQGSSHLALASISPASDNSATTGASVDLPPAAVFTVSDEQSRLSQTVAPVVAMADRLDFMDELDPSTFNFSFQPA